MMDLEIEWFFFSPMYRSGGRGEKRGERRDGVRKKVEKCWEKGEEDFGDEQMEIRMWKGDQDERMVTEKPKERRVNGAGTKISLALTLVC